MTDVVQLFSGIGVVIDEAINTEGDLLNGIQKIVLSIENKHIPLLKFEDLPDDEAISNFHSIGFLILDWNLSGVRPIPQATINNNIVFLKKLKKICFIPIFIFSDEDSRSIEVDLYENGITTQNTPLFIKKKDELDTVEKLFGEIEAWIKKTPSVYVLKKWEKTTREAKTSMISDLSSVHPSWPAVLAESIQEDGGDWNWELSNSLQNNL